MVRTLLVILFFFSTHQMLDAKGRVVSKPSDLLPPCELSNIDSYMFDFLCLNLTLVDREGNSLTFTYNDKGVFFGDKRSTDPGGKEEQVLLALIKDAFQKTYDPSLEKDKRYPYVPGKQDACFNQMTTKDAIKVLELRCKTKSEIKGSDAK